MAVSLEVRCPLLDNVLADFVGTIPSHFKLRDKETKYIFKKMAVKKRLIPREIALRKKDNAAAIEALQAQVAADFNNVDAARQLATLLKLAHTKLASKQVGKLLDQLQDELADRPFDSDRSRISVEFSDPAESTISAASSVNLWLP